MPLTPIQRALALQQTGQADRLPWQMFGAHRCFAPEKTGLIERDIELRAELELQAYERFDFDGISLGPGMWGVAEALGSKLHYQSDGPAQLERALLDQRPLGEIEISALLHSGRIPKILSALKNLQRQVGQQCSLSSNLAGPITTAAGLLGPKALRHAFDERPELADSVINMACEALLSYCGALIQQGITPTLADPFASGSVLTPAQFQRFALPALRHCFEQIQQQSGERAGLHICGQTQTFWPEIKRLPIGAFSLDNKENLAAAQTAFAGHCALLGNLAPVDLIARGDRAEIWQAVTQSVQTAGRHPEGYCLAPGCTLPAHTPLEHLEWIQEALIDASTKLWGRAAR